MAVITEPGRVAPRTEVEIRCQAADDELLLVAWLNALLYKMAVRHMLFACFCVVLDGCRLQATAAGESISITRHQPAVEVKGATYTALRVGQSA
jgi:tRNA nucleotidyltransferase (CCA-adding enzyme)